MTAIPDYIPMLRYGIGATPKDGGCLVQVAGWLADGHSWRDDVACVHPVLRGAGIKVNDWVSDADRHRLAPMAARISGSAAAVDGWTDEAKTRLNVRLALWSAYSVRDLARGDLRVDAAIGLVENWLADDETVDRNTLTAAANAANATYAAYAANAANAANAATYAGNVGNVAYAAANAANAAANVASDSVSWYEALVDEFDALTGRISQPMTEEQGRAVCAVMATS